MQNGLRNHSENAFGTQDEHSRRHSGSSTAGLAEMIEGGEQTLSQKVTEAGQQVSDSGDTLMKALTEQVRAKPILALGAAVAAGLVMNNLLKN
jgi:hypothetical protein